MVSNLAVAVQVGFIASAISFAWKQGTAIRINRTVTEDGRALYQVHGSLFFASIKNFSSQFDPKNDPLETEIDFQGARLYDHSALEAVHALSQRYEKMGKTLQIKNICEDSQLLLTRAPWVTVTRA